LQVRVQVQVRVQTQQPVEAEAPLPEEVGVGVGVRPILPAVAAEGKRYVRFPSFALATISQALHGRPWPNLPWWQNLGGPS
jgi:hypothetical protein